MKKKIIKCHQSALRLTLTITSRPSLACRLKCAISGLSPVSICVYIWWQVSISCTARSMWSPGRLLWAPSAKVPGRKHTRWSCRAVTRGKRYNHEVKDWEMVRGNDESWNWLNWLTERKTVSTSVCAATDSTRQAFTVHVAFCQVLAEVLPKHSRPIH